ncbi:hypothetical protein [Segetibacter koreensis]|uniref:hypothetical protein n=1 Tax=Segetibacter koreensis TaxID=398037 RepID=UPI00036FD967|nr:hypothetical protein [Segetibacter koreensis]
MKLKPGGKIAIFLILGILAFFLFKRYLPQNTNQDSSVTTTTAPAADSEGRAKSGDAGSTSGNEQTKSNNTTAKTENRTFDYTAEKPVNGKLKGVVEVGATGFNSFVINMDNQKRWEIVSKDFGESLAYEGLATTEDIRAGLKKYLAQMFEKGVSKNDMHFVISSGAQKEPKTAIISNELKKMGYVVNLVTPEQEGKFALKATVPPSFQDNSFLVDIGSGNTKVSWQEGTSLKAIELPGAKYYEKGTSDDAVYNEVKAEAAKIPEGKRNVGFILGGVPFTLAKQTRNGDERYTVLNPPNTYKAADKKMASGLNIYKGIVDATKCDTFVFDWDANFTIGFLLSLR